jgi:hypothetical protein
VLVVVAVPLLITDLGGKRGFLFTKKNIWLIEEEGGDGHDIIGGRGGAEDDGGSYKKRARTGGSRARDGRTVGRR